MVVIGDQPGLYKALAGNPMTAEELAGKTTTDARYVRVVVTRGGFSRFRRATETPFNLIFEARP